MSIAYNEPMNSELRTKIAEEFGEDIVFMDDKNVLLDAQAEKMMSLQEEFAKVAQQPAVMETNKIGDTKIMLDGTEYEVTTEGWKKVV